MALQAHYDLNVQMADVIILDGTRPGKLSKHVILNDVLFKNTMEVRKFVVATQQELSQQVHSCWLSHQSFLL